MKLDKDEKELLKSYEKGEWKPVKDFERRRTDYHRYAKNAEVMSKRIHILLSEKDLSNLKAKSLEEGIPYQVLVASIIHKYVSGKFREAQ